MTEQTMNAAEMTEEEKMRDPLYAKWINRDLYAEWLGRGNGQPLMAWYGDQFAELADEIIEDWRAKIEQTYDGYTE